VITPWDKSVIKDIEKGIIEANLGFMPNVSGEVIRIVVPPLTEERRRDFVKLVGQKLESGRVMLRGVRQEGREEIEKLEEEAGVSEDDVKRLYEELDKLTGEYNDRLEQMAQEKEAEVMKV
jgi:ribosome recycling factor